VVTESLTNQSGEKRSGKVAAMIESFVAADSGWESLRDIDAADLQLMGPSLGHEFRMDDLLQLDYHSAISRLEKLLLERALNRANGNRAEAARILNIHRQLLYAKLKEHGLLKPDDS
jgi:DNA-binding NtrC family response regulator